MAFFILSPDIFFECFRNLVESHVRVRFLRARVTLGLNSPRMRIKRKKEHGVVVSEKYVCLLILFVVC